MDALLKMAVLAVAAGPVRLLIGRGCAINQQDKKGISLLMYAAAKGQAEIFQMLLDAGADPFLKNHQGQDALSLARSAGHHAVEAALLAFIKRDALAGFRGRGRIS